MRIMLKVVLSLLLIMPVTPTVHAQDKPKQDPFVGLYSRTIDRHNTALSKFVNDDCNDYKAIVKDANVLTASVDTVVALIDKIPESQPLSVQIEEMETVYGTLYLTRKFVDKKVELCSTANSTPKASGE